MEFEKPPVQPTPPEYRHPLHKNKPTTTIIPILSILTLNLKSNKHLRMRFCIFENDTLYIAINDKVISYSLSSNTVEKTIFNCHGCDDANICFISVGSSISEISNNSKPNVSSHLHACYDNKVICTWDLNSGRLVSREIMKKKATAMESAFIDISKFETVINSNTNIQPVCKTVAIIADKAGNIYGYDTMNLSNNILLNGHTASIITDLIINQPSSMLVTSDRDEKIRVSNFPDATTIGGYCLGHTNVISSICMVNFKGKYLLVSCGWDHMMCLWDASVGKMLGLISFPRELNSLLNLTDNIHDKELSNGDQKSLDIDVEDGIEHVSQKHNVINGVEEEDVDENDEKRYDEMSAGNYPYKVITMYDSTVCVSFKGLKIVKLFQIIDKSETALDSSHDDVPLNIVFTDEVIIHLPDVPSDILFGQDLLIVLLPPPYFLKFFVIRISDSIKYEEITNKFEILISNITKHFNNRSGGFQFSQQTFNAVEGGDGDLKGLMKHAVGTHFDGTKHTQTMRGSKRSKKNKSENEK
eukprot:gene10163-13671_t